MQAAAPTFSPAAGVYSGAVTVTLACSSPGAVIRYTTDGTDPTAASPQYTGPVTLATSAVIKAYASAQGMLDSPEASAAYTIQLPAPAFAPAAGVYLGSVTAVLTCAIPGATICYTLDNSTPSATSAVYRAPILLTNSTTIKASAFKTGLLPSAVSAAAYTILTQPVYAPTLSLLSGAYAAPITVTITCATPGAAIRYTLDGTTPTVNSTLYQGALTFISATTVKAIALKTLMPNSAVTSASYQITGDLYEPDGSPSLARIITNGATQLHSISPAGDIDWATFSLTQASAVRIDTNGLVGGNQMWLYGPNSSTNQVAYSKAANGQFAGIHLLNANALAPGTYYLRIQAISATTIIPLYTLSLLATAANQVAPPVFAPLPGIYTGALSVTLTSDTPGAVIYYTTNGTAPTTASAHYQSPVKITSPAVIKAIAVKSGMQANIVSVGTYMLPPN